VSAGQAPLVFFAVVIAVFTVLLVGVVVVRETAPT